MDYYALSAGKAKTGATTSPSIVKKKVLFQVILRETTLFLMGNHKKNYSFL